MIKIKITESFTPGCPNGQLRNGKGNRHWEC